MAPSFATRAATRSASRPARGAETEEAGGVHHGAPVPYRFNLYACRLAAAYEYIVASYAYLQGPPEETGAHHRAVCSLGKAHIGEAFAHFFAEYDLDNLERSAIRRVA
jgi:hypothetical protein